MSREQILKELRNDKKYLNWSYLKEYASSNNLTVKYGNKYTSYLILGNGDSIIIGCSNVYGVQSISYFE